MADLLTENAIHRTQPINWGAIWAGMFTFAAIWSIFGLLGMAIFVSNANPNAAAPVTGQNWGISAWSIILTTIAMYVAGRVTARLSMSPNRVDGAIHGMVMFGLSVVGTIIIVSVADAVMSGGTGIQATVHSGYLLGRFAELGWAGFMALILGWLGAMIGGSQSSATGHPVETLQPGIRSAREIRPAA